MFPEFLVWAIVGVFAIGVGSTIGLIAVMKNFGFNEGLIIAFAASILILMLVIEAVFIGLLLSRQRGAKEAIHTGRVKEQTTNELEAGNPANPSRTVSQRYRTHDPRV